MKISCFFEGIGSSYSVDEVADEAMGRTTHRRTKLVTCTISYPLYTISIHFLYFFGS
jgi:hypothetical protein